MGNDLDGSRLRHFEPQRSGAFVADEFISCKSSHGKVDPSSEWTGLWRDLCADASEGYDMLVVDSNSSKYSFWRNTADPLNSSRPNGIIHLSPTRAAAEPAQYVVLLRLPIYAA